MESDSKPGWKVEEGGPRMCLGKGGLGSGMLLSDIHRPWHNDPQYVILEPINQVENNDSYMLTLNRELQADSYTESQGNSFSVTFPTEIPSGYFKYNISKVISTAHFSSTFFSPFSFYL